ncbi:Putative hydrolases of the haloacid dehalogenase-like (HAD) superfamily [Candidatus Phytoplasma australiense]|uniref:Putative hydrolases of the haloacid dehalogenase-like (HAD) superfamily n=1 Tax=Phytoplasma australiense TaxID=59748 RepID=B1V9E4_PHYAS|nr:HAD-IIB family hydrolase [Candidatus Phytoplasma australiense]CAM11345.1 Putative hydrolases of the haloacid dehalogenase-like (HAD) superfamily [Candidatus Phytoplasma australiense]
MKKLIFFDIDGTLRSNEKKTIGRQTQKLINQLAQNPNVTLGIATGRNYGRLDVLKGIRHLFKYWVLSNGALTMIEDKIIDEVEFSQQIILKIQKEMEKIGALMHLYSLEHIFEVPTSKNNFHNMSDFENVKQVALTKDFYLQNKIYQISLLYQKDSQKTQIKNFLAKNKELKAYFWEGGYIDLMYQQIDKSYGIKKIKKLFPNHQLICMGDGPNDLEMLKLADIAITMGNTKIEELKEISNLITPHIDEDRIYDFFKQSNLI